MKRALVVMVAVVLAVVAAASVLLYARSADRRALAGQEAREVYVTTREVPAGTSAQEALDSGLLQTALIAAKGVPDGALTEVTPEMKTMVATSDIAPGEIVLARRFGTQETGQAALVVPEGMVAVTVQLSDPGRVGPFLRPGSQIAVYDTFEARDAESGDYTPAGVGLQGSEDAINATRVLLPKAEVLAVGDVTLRGKPAPADEGGTALQGQTEEVPMALVTLAVTPLDAQRLVHGAQTGTLYAALLGTGAEIPTGTVEDRQLFAAAERAIS
jgi:pilus assembly protein CpaB